MTTQPDPTPDPAAPRTIVLKLPPGGPARWSLGYRMSFLHTAPAALGFLHRPQPPCPVADPCARCGELLEHVAATRAHTHRALVALAEFHPGLYGFRAAAGRLWHLLACPSDGIYVRASYWGSWPVWALGDRLGWRWATAKARGWLDPLAVDIGPCPRWPMLRRPRPIAPDSRTSRR